MNFLGGGKDDRVWWSVCGAAALLLFTAQSACRAPGPEIPESAPSSLASEPAAGEDEEVASGSPLDWTATASTSEPPALPPPGTAAPETERIHVLKKGDTLYSLARFYYGDEARWRDILAANRDQIQDPNRIFVGQVLQIPD